MSWPVVVASIGSAAFFAIATTLKHRSTGEVPAVPQLTAGQLGRMVKATLSHRLWLGGIVADIGGPGLQVYALHLGTLTFVLPLLVTGLLFSLLLSHATAGSRLGRRQAALALVLAVSLIGLVLISDAQAASTGHGARHAADHGPAVAATAIGVLLAGGLFLLARRSPRGRAAAMLGATVGISYAAAAALIKAASNVAGRGMGPLLVSWQLYALLAVGASGLLLNQLAFQAGPLTASLPAIATVDPLLSVAAASGSTTITCTRAQPP